MVDCILSICETYGWTIKYVLRLRYSAYISILNSSARRVKEYNKEDKKNNKDKVKKPRYESDDWGFNFKMSERYKKQVK